MLTYTPTLKPIPEPDAMFKEAVELVRTTGLASASYFQRHLKVGYARAAYILDELEEHGIIGPVNGAKPREILEDKPKPELVDEEINPTKWNKNKYADKKSKKFEIEIGTDENNKLVKFDLEKYGNLLVVVTDYINPRSAKEIIANSPAKLVFKPTDKKVARDTGVIESFDLKSPDEAILNTMYEGKTMVTINKVNPKEIYDEIYS